MQDFGSTDKRAIFYSIIHLLSTNYGLDKHSVVRKSDIKNKFKNQS